MPVPTPAQDTSQPGNIVSQATLINATIMPVADFRSFLEFHAYSGSKSVKNPDTFSQQFDPLMQVFDELTINLKGLAAPCNV